MLFEWTISNKTSNILSVFSFRGKELLLIALIILDGQDSQCLSLLIDYTQGGLSIFLDEITPLQGSQQ